MQLPAFETCPSAMIGRRQTCWERVTPMYTCWSLVLTVMPFGLGQLLTYAGITMLACLGYGAFFLVVGLFIRNPIIPALLLYGWEWINFLLPPVLKKISVIHYLNSLVPVPVSEGPFAVVGTDARLDRDSEHAGRHNSCPHPCRLSHPPPGNPLR